MTDYLLMGVGGVVIVLIIVVIFVYTKSKRIWRAYDYFMRGRDAESLEDLIMNLNDDVRMLEQEDHENKEAIRMLNKMQRASYQKFGIVHYNSFKGMGGNLSFAAALLDYTNSGFILNSVQSRDGCYVYLKVVDCGKTEILLGTEEQQALEQALGYTDRE